MAANQDQKQGDLSNKLSQSGVLPPLRAALAGASETQRYQILGALLAEWASQSGNGKQASSDQQVEILTRRVQSLTKENATLQDKVATLQADLDHRTTQLEGEQTRGHELSLLHEEQRVRLEAAQKEVGDREAQLVAKNAELHKVQVENENLQLQVQRAGASKDDQGAVRRQEQANRQLIQEVETLRTDLEQLRTDKDEEIARLTEELSSTRSAGASGAEIPFKEVWERLRTSRPPLVESDARPHLQCALRMADLLVELVRFVDNFDQLIRPFVGKYTKHHPPVKVPWEVFARRDDARATVMQAIAPVGGKPIGIVKVRLNGLYTWTQAAMIGCDAAIESVASELQTFLMGPRGAGGDPNRTIKDFLKQDGHELFLQHIRKLRGVRLAEAFGRSA